MSLIKAVSYHLVGQHEYCLQGELSLAVVEQILKTGPQQVDDHDVVVAFHAKPVYVWDADY